MHRVFIMNVLPKYIISASSSAQLSTINISLRKKRKKERNAQHAHDQEILEKLVGNTVTQEVRTISVPTLNYFTQRIITILRLIYAEHTNR